MWVLKNLFKKEKRGESAVLIDIASDSVAGAYVRYTEGETPILLYARRLPVEARKDEPRERAMERALLILGNELIREGAPILMRATGSGNAETILVSLDTAWQETRVRIENFERKEPFVFTRSIVETALEKTCVVPPEKTLADESIIGTILNGYETRDPFGKKIHRASIIILTSLIDKNISDEIISSIRGLYHTKNILTIAGSSLRYQAMRVAFPHEREALILDATESLVSIALIRKGLFIALSEVSCSSSSANGSSWIDTVKGEFAKISERYPLPRTIFLLAREQEISSLRQMLDDANLGNLWLSDNPPKIVSVLASHIAGFVRQATDTPPDLQLFLMALYFQYRQPEQRIDRLN